MITLELHNRYLEKVFNHLDELIWDDEIILMLTQTLDPDERYWHVEGKRIWRIKAWRLSQERYEERKKRMAEFQASVDKRKDFLELLTLRVMENFGLTDREMAGQLASNMLQKNKAGAIALMGLDARDCPDIGNYIILMDNNTYMEL